MYEKSLCKQINETQTNEPQILVRIKKTKNGSVTIKKINYMDFTVFTKASNNFVVLKDNSCFKIIKISASECNSKNITIEGKKWKIIGNVFDEPSESCFIKSWKLSRTSNEEMIVLDLNMVVSKFMMITISEKNIIKKRHAIHLLHT